jgi:hypothetical protein
VETLGIVLSSAFIATVLSSAVTIYISRLGYKDAYYTKLIDKRLLAHDEIGALISVLKTSIQDPESQDRRTYHQIFAFGYEHFCKVTAMFGSDTHSQWVTNRTRAALLKINREFFRCSLLFKEFGDDLVRVGKTEYKEIAGLRDELEEALLSELPELHKIDKFLAGKAVEKAISEVDLMKRPSGDES